jgi:hypothetical protein
VPAPTPEERDEDALADAEAEAEAEAEARAELEAVAALGPAGVERLAAAGDVDSLLALARAHRAGEGSIPRDLARCLAAYRAAGALGNAEAKYSVALFLLAGGVVPQDLKAGATELRAAADGGSTPAKIYLANLYEQGVHYKADQEKADVWYRSAARAAGVKAEPGSRDYTRALAELGSVRHGLELFADPATAEGEKGVIGKKMKAYGWQLRLRDPAASDPPPPSATPSAPAPAPVPVPVPAPAAAEKQAKPGAKPEKPAAKPAPKPDKPEKPAPKPRRGAGSFTPKLGLVAFLVATLFVAVGWGAGVLLAGGAQELLARGQPLPLPIGDHLALVLPAAVAAIGVLPGILLYRAGTFARALGVAALAAIGGYAAHTVPGGAFLPSIELQTTAFAVAAYLASLLVLGLFGGSRLKPPGPPPKMGIGFPSEP